MHANRLKLGECYEYLGRRCKLVELQVGPGNYSQAKILVGRSFQNEIVLEGETWDHMIFGDIGPRWEEYKRQEEAARAARKYARKLEAELKSILPLGLQSGIDVTRYYECGEIIVRGDMNQLEQIIDALSD